MAHTMHDLVSGRDRAALVLEEKARTISDLADAAVLAIVVALLGNAWWAAAWFVSASLALIVSHQLIAAALKDHALRRNSVWVGVVAAATVFAGSVPFLWFSGPAGKLVALLVALTALLDVNLRYHRQRWDRLSLSAPFLLAMCGVLFAEVLMNPSQWQAWCIAALMLAALVESGRRLLHLHGEARFQAEQAALLAEQADRGKTQFLQTMSHELRTPINAIIGYTEIVADEAGTDAVQTRADCERVLRASRHLLRLVGEILDMAKIDAGAMVAACEDVDVDQLVADVLEIAAPLARVRSNTLNLVQPSPIGTIFTDGDRLRQCLLNLLSNAAKFTTRGNIWLEVRQVERDGVAVVQFDVRDTGLGMTPPQLQALFRPFSQVDASLTRVNGGTGLGLAITRGYARLLGGDVAVTSCPGEGSNFTLWVATTRLARLGASEVDDARAAA